MYDIIIGRSEKDKEKYGTTGAVFLGKHYVKMGQTVSLSNKVYLDVVKSHVVFIVGKRGSGKCLHGDTLITLEDGSETPIKDLHTQEKKIMALNHQLKLVKSEKSSFYTRKANKLLHLKLNSGMELKLTPEHPLLTVLGWQNAENLEIGSKIATSRKIDVFGVDSMNEHEIKILAYLIAEGHIKKPMFFTNLDEVIVEDLRLALNELGRISKGSSITHEQTKIRNFLEKHGLYNLLSPDKFVPESIFKLTKNQIALFINRMFSCDGSIYRHGKSEKYWEISYASASEKLTRQIQSLLLRFGILSRLRHKSSKLNGKNFKSYEVVLDGENVIKYINEIGFFGHKEKKQSAALQEMSSIKRNPNVDVIPKEIWQAYRPKSWVDAGKTFNYKSPKALRSSIAYGPSRQKLLQIAISDNNERIKQLADSDIFWDKIVSIEMLLGEFDVYDITVPEFHNFVANNVIVHNSYTMGAVAEGIYDLPDEIRKNLSVIMLDTMGIYWTMKYANQKEKELLDEWGLESKGLNIQIYTPTGFFEEFRDKGIPTDFPFSVKTSEIGADEWCMIFNVLMTDPIGVLIERAIYELREEGTDYDIKEIINYVENDDRSEKGTKDAVVNRFMVAGKWGLFSRNGTMIEDLIIPGQISVLDVSAYTTTAGTENLRSLVIGLVAQKLFVQRMTLRRVEEEQAISREIHFFDEEKNKPKEPVVWLIIDEAHEFLPVKGKTPATAPLVTILREGRQPGISLILASQQPGKIHTDVFTQSDIVIAHRITANIDVQALGNLMQSYMREGLDKQLNDLPPEEGAAIVFDDINEKLYPIRVRPRYTWHGGSAPSAMPVDKEEFLL